MILLFFLCLSLTSSSPCRSGSCSTGHVDPKEFLEMSVALSELDRAIKIHEETTEALSSYETTIRSAVTIRKKTLTTGSRLGKGALYAAEPFYWLQRQRKVLDLLNKAEDSLAAVRQQTESYLEKISQFLYSVYHVHASKSTGCKEQKNQACTKAAARDAGIALVRLQDTYNLNASAFLTWDENHLKDGIPQQLPASLDADDSYDLGKYAYEEDDYERCIEWMNLTISLYSNEKPGTLKFSIREAYDYLSFSYYKTGDFKNAILAGESYLKFDPTSQRMRDNVQYYQSLLNQTITEEKEERYAYKYSKEQQHYKELCRSLLEDEEDRTVVAGEPTIKNRTVKASPLWEYVDPTSQQCVYLNPKISGWDSYRVGVEAVSTLPPAIVFHHFLTEWECDHLKDLTADTGKLRRSTVVDPSSGKLINAEYRTSQSVFLDRNEFVLVRELEDRVNKITGLDLELGDRLQISHYGPGGHYGPHHDFSVDHRDRDRREGNRVATVLMYLNDVAGGGATVFMSADPPIAVRPRMGAAVFWYNLAGPHPALTNHETEDEKGTAQPSEEVLQMNIEKSQKSDWYNRPDFRGENGIWETRHAACPVQAGLKWVANYWIREHPKNSHRYRYYEPTHVSKSH